MPDVWAHLADRYEQAYGPKTDSPCRPRADRIARDVDGLVLDIGCGPGLDLALFPRSVGIDNSPGMLRAARRNAPHASLVRGDMRHLPFRAGSFAAAHSCLAFIHISKAELATLLQALRPMLLPGAPVSATFFVGEGERDTGFSPLDPNAIAHYAFYSADELSQMFTSAGYRDIEVEDAVLNEPAKAGIPCLCVSAVA